MATKKRKPRRTIPEGWEINMEQHCAKYDRYAQYWYVVKRDGEYLRNQHDEILLFQTVAKARREIKFILEAEARKVGGYRVELPQNIEEYEPIPW